MKNLKKQNSNRTSHFAHHTSQNGITLIALIITIIVMLILVAVTITVAEDGGLINYAERAANETQNEMDKEQILANGKLEVDGKWYNSIDDYIAGNAIPPTYEEANKDEDGILKENAIYTVEGEGTAVVPKGFKIVEGLKGEKSIKSGLVIQDISENEFVWIPVNYTATGTLDSNGLDSGFLAVFYRSEWENNARTTDLDTTRYTEPYQNGYITPEGKTESDEYYEMMRSVQKNKGFYIGRYEAGSTIPRTAYDIQNTTIQRTTDIVVKRDVYPYNYVGWGSSLNNYTDDVEYDAISSNWALFFNQGKGTVWLSKELYGKPEDKDKYGVTSTLCYGVQWDAMLDFIKNVRVVTDGRMWGKYDTNSIVITRTEAKFFEPGRYSFSEGSWTSVTATTSSGKILTTGASDRFAAKNIFDVAGNVAESTMEVYR